MSGASNRTDDAARGAETLSWAATSDDLIRKLELLLAEEKAVPAGQKAAPAVQKAVSNAQIRGEPGIDPLSTKQLDTMICGPQPPPRSDSSIKPGPRPVLRGRFWWTLSVRLILAATVAAVLALVLIERLPSAWNIGASTDVGGTTAASTTTSDVPAAVMPVSESLSAAPAMAPVAETPSVAMSSAVAPGPEISNVAASTAVTPITVPSVTASAPAVSSTGAPIAETAPADEIPIASMSTAAPPTTGVADGGPAGSAIRPHNRDEIATYSKRGKEFLMAGDIAAARLMLQRAAEAGDPAAALALGSTYDPIVLRGIVAHGFTADRETARAWYEKAEALGAIEATHRLKLLGTRIK